MKFVVGAAVGLLVLGPFGAVLGAGIVIGQVRLRSKPDPPPPVTLVMLLLLIELRSGVSVLSALGNASKALPEDEVLGRVYSVARVSGVARSIAYADARLRPVVSRLARAQRSGASLTGSMRRMIEADLESSRTKRVARARALPVKLMLPLSLLMLPGLVLMLYAPSVMSAFDDLIGGLT